MTPAIFIPTFARARQAVPPYDALTPRAENIDAAAAFVSICQPRRARIADIGRQSQTPHKKSEHAVSPYYPVLDFNRTPPHAYRALPRHLNTASEATGVNCWRQVLINNKPMRRRPLQQLKMPC